MDLNLPPQLSTFLLAMMPLTELSGSIPIALKVFNMPLWQALFFSVLGSFLVSVFLLLLIDPVYIFFSRRFGFIERLSQKIFHITRDKFGKKYQIWGNLALFLYIVIPTPGSGAWSGSLAAWLFGIDKKLALVFMFFGLSIAGLIVAGVTLGIFSIF